MRYHSFPPPIPVVGGGVSVVIIVVVVVVAAAGGGFAVSALPPPPPPLRPPLPLPSLPLPSLPLSLLVQSRNNIQQYSSSHTQSCFVGRCCFIVRSIGFSKHFPEDTDLSFDYYWVECNVSIPPWGT